MVSNLFQTLALIAKNAKAKKVKEEASKLGAKPLTDLFNTSATSRDIAASPGAKIPPVTPTKVPLVSLLEFNQNVYISRLGIELRPWIFDNLFTCEHLTRCSIFLSAISQ